MLRKKRIISVLLVMAMFITSIGLRSYAEVDKTEVDQDEIVPVEGDVGESKDPESPVEGDVGEGKEPEAPGDVGEGKDPEAPKDGDDKKPKSKEDIEGLIKEEFLDNYAKIEVEELTEKKYGEFEQLYEDIKEMMEEYLTEQEQEDIEASANFEKMGDCLRAMEVEILINDLPEPEDVKAEDAGKIKNARDKFEKLETSLEPKGEQKGIVRNLTKLEADEAALEELDGGGDGEYTFAEELKMKIQFGDDRAKVEFSEDMGKSVYVEVQDKEGQKVGEGGMTEGPKFGIALINLKKAGDYTLLIKESEEAEENLAEIKLIVENYTFEKELKMNSQLEGEKAEVNFSEDMGKSVYVEVQDKEGQKVGEGGMTEDDPGFGTALINLGKVGNYKMLIKESEDAEDILAEIDLEVVLDKSTMEDALEDAEETKVQVSEDGKDIPEDEKWTKKEDLEALEAAIEKAKQALEGEDLTADSLQEAVDELKAAIDEYNSAKKDGEIKIIYQEVVKEDERFDLATGLEKSVWVEVLKDDEVVGEGGMTEDDGVAKINLTKRGQYMVHVKDEKAGQLIKKIILRMTDKEESKKDLEDAIKTAEVEKVEVSEDGKDISKYKKWTKQEDLDKLNEAIEKAQKILDDEEKNAQEIDKEVEALNEAIEEYNAKKKYGGKNDSSGGGGGGGGGGSSSDKDKDDEDEDRNKNRYDEDKEGDRYSSSSDDPINFRDLAGYGWAEDAIKNLAMRNIVKGKSSTRFDPSARIKRGDFAVMVARYLKLDTNNVILESNFDDVARSKYYYNAINLLANKGIVDGKGPRRFDPEAPIKREEIAKILAGLDNKSQGDTARLKGFKDNNKISDWARLPMAKLVENGTINGYNDGTIRPAGYAKRAEVAVMIYRMEIR